jgi:hypothetical protein
MHSSTEQACRPKRSYPRISLPNGMFVAWHGGDLQRSSRVKTLGMGGLFISAPNPPTVSAKLRLTCEVPGGNVGRGDRPKCPPGHGMGVEFTRMDLRDRVLLQKLMNRLLH